MSFACIIFLRGISFSPGFNLHCLEALVSKPKIPSLKSHLPILKLQSKARSGPMLKAPSLRPQVPNFKPQARSQRRSWVQGSKRQGQTPGARSQSSNPSLKPQVRSQRRSHAQGLSLRSQVPIFKPRGQFRPGPRAHASDSRHRGQVPGPRSKPQAQAPGPRSQTSDPGNKAQCTKAKLFWFHVICQF